MMSQSIAALGALALSVAVAASPAAAQPPWWTQGPNGPGSYQPGYQPGPYRPGGWNNNGYGPRQQPHHHKNNNGAAVAAGAAGLIAGVAIGAAVANAQQPAYTQAPPAYSPPPYAPAYTPAPAYAPPPAYSGPYTGPYAAQGPVTYYTGAGGRVETRATTPGDVAMSGAAYQQSCAARYRSYDPGSGTYLGYDGLRHSC